MTETARRGEAGGGGDELIFWSAEETAARVRNREVSAVEIAQVHLRQVEARNGELNALTRVNERVIDEAAVVDRLLADRGGSHRGVPDDIVLPLAGVPVTIKDNVDVAGDTTPNGVSAFDEQVAPLDAPLVEHLRAAGAVVLGRTNAPEFSWRWHTDNPLFGPTLNPWDARLTPGGSSGGASAALAAGMGCLAQGNDAGGSLRWPANCVGVSSIKPTTGRVSSHNSTAPAERPLAIDLMAVQGPMARSVADVRLMLDVMSAPTWRDPAHVPAVPLDGRRMRAGWCAGAGFAGGPHPEVAAAIELACGALEDGGWTVGRVTVPDLEVSARGWASMINTDFHQTSRPVMLELGSSAIAAMLDAFDAAGPPLDIAGLYEWMSTRATQLRNWQRLLTTDVDVVVLPVAMEPAWPAGDDTLSSQRLAEIFAANTPLVAFNFLGLPAAAQATSVVDDRPNGVQIVARRFAEHVALHAAETIEAALGRFSPAVSPTS